MSPRRSHADKVRERLLRFWEREESYGDPLGCVCTTYTFDAPFFEEECLSLFVGMQTDPREDGRVYIVEREEKLSQIFACVLVDRSQVAKERSLRWNLVPVAVPREAILHAKVSLLVWQERIRVLVGSANLTEAGYRLNYENMGVLDFTPDGETPLELLRQVVGFLRKVCGFTPGAESRDKVGPIGELDRFLDRVQSQIRGWRDVEWGRGEPSAALIPILPGAPSLFEQVAHDLWRGTGPSEVEIVSPFFDPGSQSLVPVDALASCMAVNGVRTVRFHVAGHTLPDRTIELQAPEELREPRRARWEHGFYLVAARDENGDARPLHAKHYWFAREGRALCIIGSSNFTAAGTGCAKDGRVNIEANLAYVIPASAAAFFSQCGQSAVPSTPVDLETAKVTFTAKGDRTPEGSKYVPLPSAFGLALFRPEGETGVLLLTIGQDAPSRFSVSVEDASFTFDDAGWANAGRPATTEMVWPEKRPPSYLVVDWSATDGRTHVSLWPVNVTDSSRLPPPPELRDLPLEVLIEILSSARPLHEILRRLNRQGGKGLPAVQPVVDPHKKVDTSGYLLRRVKRISTAIEGLRARLERPAHQLEALRWRLHGPVGPLALARELMSKEPEVAQFLLAEIALMMRSADWSASARNLGGETIKTETEPIIAELRRLASEQRAPPNLASYVTRVFREVAS
ncbi:MAG: phospholipase D family protein [Planctomycetota bacterium]